jgi:hypothetical protein
MNNRPLINWWGSRRRVSSLKAWAVALLLLPGCVRLAPSFQKAAAGRGFEKTPDEAYGAPKMDAKCCKPENVRRLKPLKFDSDERVIVVTMTDRKFEGERHRLSADRWVALPSEVQDICRGFTDNLKMRLRQLLGLPPDDKFDKFVLMSVRREDVFRPTYDPNPTTDYPCADSASADYCKKFPDGVGTEHKEWIAAQVQIKKYPWTGLGYTYNWTPGADRYGVSEYVVRKGSTITVTERVEYKEYCRPAR